MKTLLDWQREVHGLAVEKGWYDQPREPLGLICLIHSELSEAVEDYRKRGVDTVPYYPDGYYPLAEIPGKPEGFAVEIADALIRILDMCEYLGIDIESAMQVKHDYNKTRDHRHGGKLA